MRIAVFIFAVLFLGLHAQDVRACGCIGTSTVEGSVKGSDLVIVGTIISKTRVALTIDSEFVDPSDTLLRHLMGAPTYSDFSIRNRFQVVVNELYKGEISSDTVVVYTGFGHGDCGIKFAIGQQYIIYGDNEIDQLYQKPIFIKGAYGTDICTRTKPFDQAELDEIRKYKKAKRLPSSK